MSGLALLVGGLFWLAGVALLEAGYDVDGWPRLALGLGIALAGSGCLLLRRRLPSRVARVGAVLFGATALITGVSQGIPGFLSFLGLYTGVLFVLPVVAAVLGMGLVRGGGIVRWGRPLPLVITVVAVVTYTFHALAREVWDPPDAVYFITVGAVWTLLGVAVGRTLRIGAHPGPPGADHT